MAVNGIPGDIADAVARARAELKAQPAPKTPAKK
jgi:hypothetical protein